MDSVKLMMWRLAHRYHSEPIRLWQLTKAKYDLNITLIMFPRNNSDYTEVQLDIFGPVGPQISCLELTADERTQRQAWTFACQLSKLWLWTARKNYQPSHPNYPFTHTLKRLAILVSHNTQMLIHTDRKPHSSRLEERSPTSVNQQQILQEEKPALSTEKID